MLQLIDPPAEQLQLRLHVVLLDQGNTCDSRAVTVLALATRKDPRLIVENTSMRGRAHASSLTPDATRLALVQQSARRNATREYVAVIKALERSVEGRYASISISKPKCQIPEEAAGKAMPAQVVASTAQ